jgi:hypothetical protein
MSGDQCVEILIPETTMDFIERGLGFSPDNGNGSLEFLLIVIPCVLLVYAIVRRLRAADRGLPSGA